MKYKCSNCGKEFHCQPDRDEHERACGQSVMYFKYTMDRDSTLTETDIRITERYVGDKTPMPGVADWSIDDRHCSVWMPENADMEKVCEILKKEIVSQYPYFVLEFPLDKSGVDFGLERRSENQHNESVTYVPEENAVRFWHKGGEVEAAIRHDKEVLKSEYMRIWKCEDGTLPVTFQNSTNKESVVQNYGSSPSIGCRKEDAREAYQKLKDYDPCFGIKYFRVSSHLDGRWDVEELKQPPEEGLWNVWKNRLGGYAVTVPSGSIEEARQLLKAAWSVDADHRIVCVSLVLKDVPQFNVKDTGIMGKICDYSVRYSDGELYTEAFKEDVELARKRLLEKARIACNAIY